MSISFINTSSLFKQVRSRFPQLSFRNYAGHQNQRSPPFVNGAKQFYNVVHRNQIQHEGYIQMWRRNPFIFSLVTSFLGINIYLGNSEAVPYIKRTQLMLLPRWFEERLGEELEENEKDEYYEGKIVPPDHPDNIRVQRISQRIIAALHSSKEKVMTWSTTYNIDHEFSGSCGTLLLIKALTANDHTLYIEDERLKRLKWKFIVVENPKINAGCLLGGTIVLYTGLLNHFRDDTDVATVIGHEVGHAVARHFAETISKIWWLVLLDLIVSRFPFVNPDTVKQKFENRLLIMLPFRRRNELESDYIGLKLMASAGYDPRLAPKFYEQKDEDDNYSDHLSTHPSAKKRIQLLTQTEVMNEALDLYREFKEGRGIEDQYPKSHKERARAEAGA